MVDESKPVVVTLLVPPSAEGEVIISVGIKGHTPLIRVVPFDDFEFDSTVLELVGELSEQELPTFVEPSPPARSSPATNKIKSKTVPPTPTPVSSPTPAEQQQQLSIL